MFLRAFISTLFENFSVVTYYPEGKQTNQQPKDRKCDIEWIHLVALITVSIKILSRVRLARSNP